MSWYDLDLTFDLAVVTLTSKILSGLYLGICKVKEVDIQNIQTIIRPYITDIFIDSYSPVKKSYSFITFSLLNCVVLILNLYMQFSESIPICVLFHYLCTVSLLLYLMVLKTISPGCGVLASLMLFLHLYS